MSGVNTSSCATASAWLNTEQGAGATEFQPAACKAISKAGALVARALESRTVVPYGAAEKDLLQRMPGMSANDAHRAVDLTRVEVELGVRRHAGTDASRPPEEANALAQANELQDALNGVYDQINRIEERIDYLASGHPIASRLSATSVGRERADLEQQLLQAKACLPAIRAQIDEFLADHAGYQKPLDPPGTSASRAEDRLMQILEQGNRLSNETEGDLGAKALSQLSKRDPGFSATLTEGKGSEVMPGVKLMSSGNAAKDEATRTELQKFFEKNPELAARVENAAQSMPIYVAVAPDFKRLGMDGTAINVGLQGEPNGKPTAQLIGFQQATIDQWANNEHHRGAMDNEFWETAIRGDAGANVASSAPQQAATYVVSNLNADNLTGQPLQFDSAKDFYNFVDNMFDTFEEGYRNYYDGHEQEPSPEVAQAFADEVNERLNEVFDQNAFKDGKVEFIVADDGSLEPTLIPANDTVANA